VKIGFKFQPLGKISNISAADPPSSFRSIPTLCTAGVWEGGGSRTSSLQACFHSPHCRRHWRVTNF